MMIGSKKKQQFTDLNRGLSRAAFNAADASAVDEIRLTDERCFTIGRVGFAVELYFKDGDDRTSQSAGGHSA